ncbi:MAG: 2,4'-dihydroxyacetophenone dioxygenase family protein [Solirubrobacterales bacterium]
MSADLTALETRHLDPARMPDVPFTPYSEHVTIKLLRIDRASGQLALILKGPPGAHIGKHKHYGSVTLYTISGAWRYLEHDWVARAGDFVFETASSSHTFVTEGDEMVEVFVVVEGALEFLDEDDNTIGIEDWQSQHRRYLDYCREQGIEPLDVTALNEMPVS